MDGWTDTQKDRKIDLANEQMDRQADEWTEGQMDSQTD